MMKKFIRAVIPFITAGAVILVIVAMSGSAFAQEDDGSNPERASLGQPGEISYLSGPAQGDPMDIAQSFIDSNRGALGLSDEDLSDIVVTDRYTDDHNGVTHIYMQQRYNGVSVHGAVLSTNLARDGSVINLHSNFVSDLAAAVNTTTPGISAEAAVDAAAAEAGLTLDEPLRVIGAVNGEEHSVLFTDGGISIETIPARLRYQPVESGAVRLAWEVEIYTLDAQNYWVTRVDAVTGEALSSNNLVVNDNWGDALESEAKAAGAPDGSSAVLAAPLAPDDYTVFALPNESPNHSPTPPPGDGRSVEVDPANGASPFAWHDTDGSVGAEYTITRGNNAHAYADTNNSNSPDGIPGAEPDGGPGLSFSFPIDFTMAPINSISASVTNLFYWNNIIHDVMHNYGFDEVGGNFQENNYGNGGLGSDYVFAEAQDGGGDCNANFGTPPDGSNPRMQMYNCTNASPSRDGSLDNGVIVHEYGHGISNRLTGGPGNVGCLLNAEQGGEGWSDYYALMFTQEPGDTGPDSRGMGTYLFGQPANGPGIRPSPYSTNFAVNSYTYGDIGGLIAPHGVGFVWATTMWEVTWELIGDHGFNPDIYDGWASGGNNLAMQLVTDGMKLQPCSPGFVDARDGVLLADVALTSGANQCSLWEGFARRGLGFSAGQGSAFITGDETEAFDLPPACQSGIVVTPSDMTSDQPTDTMINQTLTISNNSVGDLDWMILEDGPSPLVSVSSYTPPQAAATSASMLMDQAENTFTTPESNVGSMPSGGNLLLDQQPNQSNGIFTDAVCDFCGGGPQVLAENFVFSTTETVGQIVLWSGYFPGNVPAASDAITVVFHQDAAGLPGSVVAAESNVPVSRVQTGVVLFGVDEWKHTITLQNPVMLTPGNYWVEIYNNTGPGDDFFWEVSNPDTLGAGLPGSAFSFTAPGSAWNYDGINDLALQLISDGDCIAPEDVPWLNVNPTSGTTASGGADHLDVTFDSTGLAVGSYDGNICVSSNDADDPLVIVPVELNVVPTINFTKTVGTDPSVCAATDAITVTVGTDVTYCYEVENTSNVTLTYHNLTDTELGTILTDFNFALSPGATAFVTQTETINTTTVNTATWMANNSNFIDISGSGTALGLTDDGEADVTMPFNFTFYGVTSDQLCIGNNGGILFDQPGCGLSFSNGALPNAGIGLAILPFWDDIDADTGDVYYETVGSSPNRTFIVQWDNRPHFSNSGSTTFQTILYETSNEILFIYQDVDFGNPSWDYGASATVGLNESGASAVQYSYNEAEIQDGMSIQFAPPAYNPLVSMSPEASATDSATVNVLTPVIDVDPASVTSTQAPDAIITQSLTISNIGQGFLDWMLEEAPPELNARWGDSVANEPNSENETSPTSRQPLSALPLGDELFQVDAGSSTGSIVVLGVEVADDHYWVTAAGVASNAEPNYLYKLDLSGNVVMSTTQSTVSVWGWRDLAYDGNYLYASDSTVLDEIDPATGLVTGNTIPCPDNPCRALAYDPATDHFWTQNFLGSLYEFDRSGTVINTYATGLAAYGAAWDTWSAGGPYIWIWSQDGPPNQLVTATQIDPTNGTATGVNFIGSQLGGSDIAGGATITPDVIPGTLVFVGLHQTDTDSIVGYDMDVQVGACYSPTDLPWVSVAPGSGSTPAGSSDMISVVFDSTGLSTGVYTGTLCVNSNDPVSPLVSVPLTLTIPASVNYGVSVSGDQAGSGLVGTTITYTLMVTNTGNVADIFDLESSGNSWITSLSANTLVLQPGEAGTVEANVDVPVGANNGDMDIATFTATSQGDSGVSESADLISTATTPATYIYLPIIRREP